MGKKEKDKSKHEEVQKGERCPCCGNHCRADKLGCKRGRKHFAELAARDEDDPVAKRVRQCAKAIKKGKTGNALSPEDEQTLCELLDKWLKK